jgi:hypothetical protein
MKYIYSPHHQGLVLAPLMEPVEKINFNGIHPEDQDQAAGDYCREFDTWLSSPPIYKVRPEDIEWFSVERGEDEFETLVEFLSHDEKTWMVNIVFTKQELRYAGRPFRTVAIPKKGNESQTPCNGRCGMNYCDEYGCIENKPEGDVSHLLVKPTVNPQAPPAPQSVPIIPGSDAWAYNRKQELSKQGLLKEEIIATMKKEFAEWRKVGNESKEQSPSIDLDQVVYVPTSVKDETPPFNESVVCLSDGDNLGWFSFPGINSWHVAIDDHTITHWLKKTTIRELIHQPYK